MKSKIIVVLLTLLTVVSITYAYLQRKEAEFQRDQVNEMHREVVKLREESEAARLEAAKLRAMAEKMKEAAVAAELDARSKGEAKTKK